VEIVTLLKQYGRYGALGLSRAAEDPDEMVRKEAREALAGLNVDVREGAIIRGPMDRKRIALVFTGHEYAEGGETILNELARHKAKASFFLTGDFLANPGFRPLIERMIKEEHYIGPHSDKHLLYCSWDEPNKSLVTREEFDIDLMRNVSKIAAFDSAAPLPAYFLPAYEHYNREIVEWAADRFYLTINYTPGTRSNADYTGEADRNFVSSQAIFDSIMARERQDPHGLNGFILLLHLGAGPGRTDKFYTRFGELLDRLAEEGYSFVSLDELFDPQPTEEKSSNSGR